MRLTWMTSKRVTGEAYTHYQFLNAILQWRLSQDPLVQRDHRGILARTDQLALRALRASQVRRDFRVSLAFKAGL